MKKLNIFGSTGTIGFKTLNIIDKYFTNYKINYLFGNNNYRLLAKQANKYKPKYVGIYNHKHYFKFKKLINNKKISILSGDDCYNFINENVDYSIIAISGISALKPIEKIIRYSKTVGLINKESIVSAGKFIKSLSKKYNTKIVPLDSEHHSIYNYLLNIKDTNKNQIKKIILTASGGPFLNTNIKNLKDVYVKDAIKHPTWKMGLKNSIDSSTLVNKCLEIIEANNLFNFDYSDIDIIIHPESLVHSIIENIDGTLIANISLNDMSIPIFNFLDNNKIKLNQFKRLDLSKIKSLNFFKPDRKKFNILRIFDKLDKNSLSNIIVFNTSNEFAVDMFINKRIKFIDITKIIDQSLNKFEKISIYNINDVIKYQNYVYNKLYNDFF